MKKTISLLSFLFLFYPMLFAQWDGFLDVDVDLSTLPGKTYSQNIAAFAPLIINGDTLDVSCAEMNFVKITITDNGPNATVSVCSTTDTVNYRLKNLVITNNKGAKLTLVQGETKPDFDFDFTISTDTLNVYYDALVLLKGSLQQKQIVYKKYKLNQSTVNGFFSPNVLSDLSGLQSAGSTLSTDFGSSQAKGIDVTKLADGFAKFLANRFKKELTISFFNRFKAKLNASDMRDLRTLFSNTTSELNLIDDKFTHYEAYLSSLRQSMEIDCHQLPEQFKKLLETPTSQLSGALESKPDAQYILDNVLTFGIEISDSVHIGKALSELDLSKNWNANPVNKNLMGSFEAVQLISESLRNIETTPEHSYWISDIEIKGLLTNTDLLNLYFGLLSEKAKLDNINLTSESLFTLMTSKKTTDVKNVIESTINSIQAIEAIYASTKGNVAEREKDIIALQYFDAATELINTSSHLATLLPKKDAQELTKFNNLAANLNDMTRSFVTQKYSIGLLYLSRVFTEIDSTSKTLKKINGVLGNQGLFIAQMAESTSSDDVASILENFAAPTGSWRDKRTAKWNVALDSYVGPGYYIINENDKRLAFSTPVGVSLTIPFNYVTFMVSAVDLGPLTSFRLTNDTSQVANVFLKEIIAPGAFVSVNFGENFPITINVGYQQFPLLEKVGTTQNDVNITRDTGFTGSININIPIFTLYNERKD